MEIYHKKCNQFIAKPFENLIQLISQELHYFVFTSIFCLMNADDKSKSLNTVKIKSSIYKKSSTVKSFYETEVTFRDYNIIYGNLHFPEAWNLKQQFL